MLEYEAIYGRYNFANLKPEYTLSKKKKTFGYKNQEMEKGGWVHCSFAYMGRHRGNSENDKTKQWTSKATICLASESYASPMTQYHLKRDSISKRQADWERDKQKSQCPTHCNCSHVSDCERRHTQSLCLLQTLYLLCNQSHSNKKGHLERVKMSLQNTSYIMHIPSNIHALQAEGWRAKEATSQAPYDFPRLFWRMF